MARRSARLASSSKGATASAAPQLGSVIEREEPTSTPAEKASKRLNTVASSPMPQPATPAVATPVKLPMSEMHPSKVHPTTAAPSSGLKLGFVDIDYTKPAALASGVTQSTPSKTPFPSSDFTFRYTKLHGSDDKGLSPEAKQMMDGLREEAAKIKVELAAKRDQEKLEAELNDRRKIRHAKGKAGRFSAAHMAEFKKMDSIENHPSAFRTAPGRFPPTKTGLKRSQSKANLDEPDSARSKKGSTRPVLKSPEKQQEQPESPVKRAKQRLDDDVSTLRPVSRDGSFLPRPKSSGNDSVHSSIPRLQALTNLMTPTKASLARANSVKTPATTLAKHSSKPDLAGLAKSAGKPNLASLARASSKKGLDSLKKAMITNGLSSDKQLTLVQTPGRFDRVKSMFKRQISGSKPKSQIPQLVASPSKTSLQQNIEEELPHTSLTTPGRKLEQHVESTPTTKRSTMILNSPSPVKSSIPRFKAVAQLQPSSSTAGKSTRKNVKGEVTYPDLSAYCRDVKEDAEESSTAQFPESVPGTFTFRSDHTIRFESASPKGFGSAAGQASIRQVRNSILPTSRMPGSFPRASDVSPNKENKVPPLGPGIPHGMSNKKRHRASWDEEEEDEAEKRAAKKLRKDPAVEGHALVAPRLVGQASPAKMAHHTPSPQKKGGLSLSRLNMLARPKVRK
ncbi:hypothetical protein F5Y06DRAFT_148339 [Hypoxylon sp. FL0890]|nr:hypothetical protein F5Y06DRAFT_148339 [Hypoxylon sp. FL0890]